MWNCWSCQVSTHLIVLIFIAIQNDEKNNIITTLASLKHCNRFLSWKHWFLVHLNCLFLIFAKMAWYCSHIIKQKLILIYLQYIVACCIEAQYYSWTDNFLRNGIPGKNLTNSDFQKTGPFNIKFRSKEMRSYKKGVDKRHTLDLGLSSIPQRGPLQKPKTQIWYFRGLNF